MRFAFCLVAVFAFATSADAFGRRSRLAPAAGATTVTRSAASSQSTSTSSCPNGKCSLTTTATSSSSTVATTTAAVGSADALDVVNAQRAARGLRPYLRDDGLAAAAHAAAAHRAERRLFGHTENDFRFLPVGARATAAGCAAYPAHYGFMACATYENHTYAGAASVTGPDGRVYHHLVVR